jgi:hypothetical protein
MQIQISKGKLVFMQIRITGILAKRITHRIDSRVDKPYVLLYGSGHFMRRYLCLLSFFVLAIAGVAYAQIPTSWSTLGAERTFPTDSGMINVKTAFGAAGDGVTDDTAAIQRAISSTIHQQNTSRILYFPAGTYLVSRPLVWKDLGGNWQSELTIQGENETTTKIKLANNSGPYQNPKAPADLFTTASVNAGPNGDGNSAFDNYFFDITIDVGSGNPGAVALDFMGNNYCGLRNVTLMSSDPAHAGAAGLSMTRYATGPCLMKNVVINGFQTGILAGNTEYGVTFENLLLENQLSAGIANSDNSLSIHNLIFTNNSNTVPAIQNLTPAGLITLIDASLSGGSGAPSTSAIQNLGVLYARNVTTSGFQSAVQDNTGTIVPGVSLTEYDSGPTFSLFQGPPSSLGLPIKLTPEFEETNLKNWRSVVAYGADPTGAADSTAGIQAAIDSGGTTVYFPAGIYRVSKTIIVRGSVRMIEGFDSNVLPELSSFQNANSVAPFFRFENTADVTLSHLRLGGIFSQQGVPGLRWFEHDSSNAVTIRNTVLNNGTYVTSAYKNAVTGTGDLYLEDIAGAYWEIDHPQNIYARQLDMETPARKFFNKGGTLWLLGIKTELAGDATHVAAIIDTEFGGKTEVLGGLVFIRAAAPVPANQSAFVINNSQASLVYALSSVNSTSTSPTAPNIDFNLQVEEVQAGVVKTLSSDEVQADIAALPFSISRGPGLIMPLYSSKQ